MKQFVISVIVLLSIVLFSNLANAQRSFRFDPSTSQYEESVTDMRVKVLGGYINIKRRYSASRWMLNPHWSPLGIKMRGGAVDYIKREKFTYKRIARRVGDDTTIIARFADSTDFSKQVIQTTTGYIWTNRGGDKIYYNNDAYPTSYKNKNSVEVTFLYNEKNKIIDIKDHLNKSIVTISYDATGLNPRKVEDYAGRTVLYEGSFGYSGVLNAVTDIDGKRWQYEYEYRSLGNNHDLTPYLKKIIDPNEEQTVLTNVGSLGGWVDHTYLLDGGGFTGQACVPGHWIVESVPKAGSDELISKEVYIPAKGCDTQATKIRRRYFAPSMTILTGITFNDGRYIKYGSYYDTETEEYTRTTKYSDGKETQEIFSAGGKPTQKTVGGNIVSSQVKTANRRITEDGLGNQTNTYYDQWDNIKSIKHPDGTTESFTYHPSFNLPREHKDQRGFITKFEYDDNGNLTKLTQAAGTAEQRVTEFDYDDYGQVLEQRVLADNNGPQITQNYTYDDYGNIKTYTDGRRIDWKFTGYTAGGQPRFVTDGRNKVWKYTYLDSGKAETFTSPLNKVTRFTYFKNGRLKSQIDPALNTTTYAYNARSEVTKVSDDLGVKAQMDYYTDGRIKNVKDGESRGRSFSYDRQMRLKAIKDDLGNSTSYTYQGEEQNAMSLIASITSPEGKVSFEYNQMGQPTKQHQVSLTGGAKLTTHIGYNKAQMPDRIEDPANNINISVYNGLGQLSQTTDANQANTEISYNNQGLVTQVQDAEQTRTTYEYDGQGNRIAEILEMGQRFDYDYDNNGNLIKKTDAEKQVIIYDYNDDNQLVSETWYANEGATADKANALRTHVYSYYDNGLLKSVLFTGAGGFQELSYAYNKRGELTSETTNFGAFAKTTGYDYYNNGLLKAVNAPDGNNASYQYDSANRLTLATMSGSGSVVVNAYQGQLPKQLVYPGGVTRQQNYDGFGRLEQIKVADVGGNTIEQLDYAYDLAGNIKTKQSLGGAFAYGYDAVNRLTTATQPTPLENLSFDYDDVGNRIKSTEQATWAYNPNQQLEQQGMKFYNYDANGNLLTVNQDSKAGTALRSHSYNGEGRLSSVSEGSTLLASYEYDSFGRRIKRTAGSDVSYFLYSQQGLVGEYDSSGNLKSGYQYPPNSTWGTSPWYQKTAQGAGTGFYQNDHLGAPVVLSKNNGKTLWQGSYDAFGQVTETVNLTGNNLRFPGQWKDDATGYHYNYFRDYDPSIGRYIQRDPIGLGGGINTYGYANGNPVNLYDPNGRAAVGALGVCVAWPIGTISCGAVAVYAAWAAYTAVDGTQKAFESYNNSCPTEDNIDEFAFPGDDLDRPGTCSDSELDFLQRQKDNSCNRPRKCNAQLDSCSEIMQKMTQGMQCTNSRNKLNSMCFKGGDKAHIRESTRASKTISECAVVARMKSCPGF